MNRTTVGKKLQALRESKGLSRAQFRKLTGINFPQIQSTEEGMHFPRLDLLQRWLHACGTTLSKFFEDLEAELDTTKPKPYIIPGFEDYYDNLNRIIRSGSKYYRQGIESNLKALATSAEEEAKTQKAEQGNNRPKEKKKRSVERKAG